MKGLFSFFSGQQPGHTVQQRQHCPAPGPGGQQQQHDGSDLTALDTSLPSVISDFTEINASPPSDVAHGGGAGQHQQQPRQQGNPRLQQQQQQQPVVSAQQQHGHMQQQKKQPVHQQTHGQTEGEDAHRPASGQAARNASSAAPAATAAAAAGVQATRSAAPQTPIATSSNLQQTEQHAQHQQRLQPQAHGAVDTAPIPGGREVAGAGDRCTHCQQSLQHQHSGSACLSTATGRTTTPRVAGSSPSGERHVHQPAANMPPQPPPPPCPPQQQQVQQAQQRQQQQVQEHQQAQRAGCGDPVVPSAQHATAAAASDAGAAQQQPEHGDGDEEALPGHSGQDQQQQQHQTASKHHRQGQKGRKQQQSMQQNTQENIQILRHRMSDFRSKQKCKIGRNLEQYRVSATERFRAAYRGQPQAAVVQSGYLLFLVDPSGAGSRGEAVRLKVTTMRGGMFHDHPKILELVEHAKAVLFDVTHELVGKYGEFDESVIPAAVQHRQQVGGCSMFGQPNLSFVTGSAQHRASDAVRLVVNYLKARAQETLPGETSAPSDLEPHGWCKVHAGPEQPNCEYKADLAPGEPFAQCCGQFRQATCWPDDVPAYQPSRIRLHHGKAVLQAWIAKAELAKSFGPELFEEDELVDGDAFGPSAAAVQGEQPRQQQQHQHSPPAAPGTERHQQQHQQHQQQPSPPADAMGWAAEQVQQEQQQDAFAPAAAAAEDQQQQRERQKQILAARQYQVLVPLLPFLKGALHKITEAEAAASGRPTMEHEAVDEEPTGDDDFGEWGIEMDEPPTAATAAAAQAVPAAAPADCNQEGPSRTADGAGAPGPAAGPAVAQSGAMGVHPASQPGAASSDQAAAADGSSDPGCETFAATRGRGRQQAGNRGRGRGRQRARQARSAGSEQPPSVGEEVAAGPCRGRGRGRSRGRGGRRGRGRGESNGAADELDDDGWWRQNDVAQHRPVLTPEARLTLQQQHGSLINDLKSMSLGDCNIFSSTPAACVLVDAVLSALCKTTAQFQLSDMTAGLNELELHRVNILALLQYILQHMGTHQLQPAVTPAHLAASHQLEVSFSVAGQQQQQQGVIEKVLEAYQTDFAIGSCNVPSDPVSGLVTLQGLYAEPVGAYVQRSIQHVLAVADMSGQYVTVSTLQEFLAQRLNRPGGGKHQPVLVEEDVLLVYLLSREQPFQLSLTVGGASVNFTIRKGPWQRLVNFSRGDILGAWPFGDPRTQTLDALKAELKRAAGRCQLRREDALQCAVWQAWADEQRVWTGELRAWKLALSELHQQQQAALQQQQQQVLLQQLLQQQQQLLPQQYTGYAPGAASAGFWGAGLRAGQQNTAMPAAAPGAQPYATWQHVAQPGDQTGGCNVAPFIPQAATGMAGERMGTAPAADVHGFGASAVAAKNRAPDCTGTSRGAAQTAPGTQQAAGRAAATEGLHGLVNREPGANAAGVAENVTASGLPIPVASAGAEALQRVAGKRTADTAGGDIPPAKRQCC